MEFGRFGFGRAGHAGKLFVHAEIILEGDGSERLIFALDLHAFFGLDGLVQTVGPAASRHLASGEFVDDHHFAVFHHVVDVLLEERVRAQSLVDVVDELHVLRIVEVAEVQQPLALRHAFFGQRRGAHLFVERVIHVDDQLRDDLVDSIVFIGRFFGGAGNNQRRARLVDQDRVDFVDDSELMAALDALREIVFHVVAQVVESEFVVRAVGDVRCVGRAPLHVVEIVNDHADREPQHLIDRAHPLRVAPRQVIVHGDDVHAEPGERIQIRGQRGDERFSFARLHLGDFPSCRTIPPIICTSKWRMPERSAAGFARQRKGRRDRGFERLLQFPSVVEIVALDALEAFGDLGAQRGRALGDLRVGELFHLGLELVDARDHRRDPLHVALVLRPDKFRDYAVYDLLNVHVGYLPLNLSWERIPLTIRCSFPLHCICWATFPQSRASGRVAFHGRAVRIPTPQSAPVDCAPSVAPTMEVQKLPHRNAGARLPSRLRLAWTFLRGGW